MYSAAQPYIANVFMVGAVIAHNGPRCLGTALLADRPDSDENTVDEDLVRRLECVLPARN